MASALKRALLTAAMLALSATGSYAFNSDGFQSPSGNIMCLHDPGAGGGSIRCMVGQTDTPPPRRPRDCELEWSDFELHASARRAGRICHGDTIADSYPTLGYGQVWRRGSISCQSARTGIICRNAHGAGFELSRARQRAF